MNQTIRWSGTWCWGKSNLSSRYDPHLLAHLWRQNTAVAIAREYCGCAGRQSPVCLQLSGPSLLVQFPVPARSFSSLTRHLWQSCCKPNLAVYVVLTFYNGFITFLSTSLLTVNDKKDDVDLITLSLYFECLKVSRAKCCWKLWNWGVWSSLEEREGVKRADWLLH